VTRSCILTDVTTYISADDYLSSKASEKTPEDPFALQAYSDLAQTLIFYENIYVPHPIKLKDCSNEDFGTKPAFLSELLKRGIVKPLNLNAEEIPTVAQNENALLSWLQTEGAEYIGDHLLKMQQVDQSLPKQSSFQGVSFSRLCDWAKFQSTRVRKVNDSHRRRIPTENGIEQDSFGEWARSLAIVFRKRFADIGQELYDYVVATLLRALRYRIRANITDMVYQSHAIRRDFVLRCSCYDCGVPEDMTNHVIGLIRGIYDDMVSATQDTLHARVRLLRFTVPLLGGKLWGEDDVNTGRLASEAFIVDRIQEYRDRIKPLRSSIAGITDEEDFAVVERDLEEIRVKLEEYFGLRNTSLTEVEKAVVDTGLGTLDVSGHFAKGQGLLFSALSSLKRRIFLGSSPLQQLLFREFRKGWKKTKYLHSPTPSAS